MADIFGNILRFTIITILCCGESMNLLVQEESVYQYKKSKRIKVTAFFTFLFFMVGNIFANIAFPQIPLNTFKFATLSFPRELAISNGKHFFSNKNDLVIYIQDAHCNYNAQKNIVNILEIIHKQVKNKKIYTEGSEGRQNLSLFKSFPLRKAKQDIFGKLMQEGDITGVENFIINTNDDISLIGVDKEEIYLKNIEAYVRANGFATGLKDIIGEFENAVSFLRNNVLSDNLREFLYKQEKFQDAVRVDPLEYVRYLNGLINKFNINVKNYKTFAKLIKIQRYQLNINEKKLFSESQDLTNNYLLPCLNDDEMNKVALNELDFKAKRITALRYYGNLKALSLKYCIDFRRFENINLYYNYLNLSKDIDPELLLKECKAIEKIILKKLVQDKKDRDITKLVKNFKILKDIIRLEAVPDELRYFRRHYKLFKAAAINKILSGYGAHIIRNGDLLDDALPYFAGFYDFAEKREKIFLKNILKDKNGVKVLFAGGYHKSGIKRLLERKRISYLFLIPRIGSTPKVNLYKNTMKGYSEYFGIKEGKRGGTVIPVSKLAVGSESPVYKAEYEKFLQKVLPSLNEAIDTIVERYIKGNYSLSDIKRDLKYRPNELFWAVQKAVYKEFGYAGSDNLDKNIKRDITRSLVVALWNAKVTKSVVVADNGSTVVLPSIEKFLNGWNKKYSDYHFRFLDVRSGGFADEYNFYLQNKKLLLNKINFSQLQEFYRKRRIFPPERSPYDILDKYELKEVLKISPNQFITILNNEGYFLKENDKQIEEIAKKFIDDYIVKKKGAEEGLNVVNDTDNSQGKCTNSAISYYDRGLKVKDKGKLTLHQKNKLNGQEGFSKVKALLFLLTISIIGYNWPFIVNNTVFWTKFALFSFIGVLYGIFHFLKNKNGVNTVYVSAINKCMGSIDINKDVGFVYAYNSDERKKQAEALLQEINKELEKPGSGRLPKIAIISDYHGDIGKFLELLSDALTKIFDADEPIKIGMDVPIVKQLREQGFSIEDMNGAIYLNGDLLDRGDYGFKCFELAMEIIDTFQGKAHYVSGNHDFWAFSNLLGIHLPWYEGFNFYGDEDAKRIVAEYRQKEPKKVNSFSWWTNKLAEYNRSQEQFENDFKIKEGKFKGKSLKEIRRYFIEFYSEFSKNFTEEQIKVWENFLGYFHSISVDKPYVGLNGVGKTSYKWWNDVEIGLSKGFESRKKAGASELELSVWNDAIALVCKIKAKVNAQHFKYKNEGKWWAAVFEAINTQAYISVEWWAKDWASHKGWGQAVFDELNRRMTNGVKINQSNYPSNKSLQKLANFYRKNFNLFQRDPYGNLLTHGWLPVDENGVKPITYKGVTYKGKDILKLLRLLSDDIKDTTKPLYEIWEAMNLINSWYADATTQIKPAHVRNYINNVGVDKINKKLGVRNWFTGHNILSKLKIPFMSVKNNYAHFSIDKGMAKKFGSEGAYVLIGNNGIVLRGYEYPENTEHPGCIIDNPVTTIYDKKTGEIKKTIQNRGLDREIFLRNVKADLEKELGIIGDASGIFDSEHGLVSMKFIVGNIVAACGALFTGGAILNALDYSSAVKETVFASLLSGVIQLLATAAVLFLPKKIYSAFKVFFSFLRMENIYSSMRFEKDTQQGREKAISIVDKKEETAGQLDKLRESVVQCKVNNGKADINGAVYIGKGNISLAIFEDNVINGRCESISRGDFKKQYGIDLNVPPFSVNEKEEINKLEIVFGDAVVAGSDDFCLAGIKKGNDKNFMFLARDWFDFIKDIDDNCGLKLAEETIYRELDKSFGRKNRRVNVSEQLMILSDNHKWAKKTADYFKKKYGLSVPHMSYIEKGGWLKYANKVFIANKLQKQRAFLFNVKNNSFVVKVLRAALFKDINNKYDVESVNKAAEIIMGLVLKTEEIDNPDAQVIESKLLEILKEGADFKRTNMFDGKKLKTALAISYDYLKSLSKNELSKLKESFDNGIFDKSLIYVEEWQKCDDIYDLFGIGSEKMEIIKVKDIDSNIVDYNFMSNVVYDFDNVVVLVENEMKSKFDVAAIEAGNNFVSNRIRLVKGAFEKSLELSMILSGIKKLYVETGPLSNIKTIRLTREAYLKLNFYYMKKGVVNSLFQKGVFMVNNVEIVMTDAFKKASKLKIIRTFA